MNTLENNAFYWQKLDTLYHSSELSIERKKNSIHPNYANLVYPVDYGYLKDMIDKTVSIGIFKGTQKSNSIQAIAVSADILKKDCEVKLIVGCSEEELMSIMLFLNQTDFQKAILVQRGSEVPFWASTN